MRELCGRSRFARTVDTNQKNHFGPIRQRTKLRVGDGKRLLDVGTRDLDNISGRDPALTPLQFFNDPKRHRHAEVRLDQSFFQFIPIDISATESLDQVLEKSDCHRFRILEKPNRVAESGARRAGSPSRLHPGLAAWFSTGGSDIRPYRVPTELYASLSCCKQSSEDGLGPVSPDPIPR